MAESRPRTEAGNHVQEHLEIIDREANPERKAFYQMCWYLGGSQGDIASLHAEDVDWDDCTVGYRPQEVAGRGQRPALIHFGKGVQSRHSPGLPQQGPLFPYSDTVRPVTAPRSLSSGARVEDPGRDPALIPLRMG